MSKFYKTDEFKKLQREWYQKLYNDGFKDHEYFSFEESDGQDSIMYDKVNFRIINKLRHMNLNQYREHRLATYQHYSALRNFLTNVDLQPDLDRKLLELYTDGVPYRKITEQLKSFVCRYPPSNRSTPPSIHFSIYYVHTRLKVLKNKAFIWNATHPEGIINDYTEDDNLY